MKAKTRFRLVILIAVVAAAGASGGAFVLWRKHANHLRDENYRKDGLAAFHAGNFGKAIDDLGHYAPNHETDKEVLYAMAQSLLVEDTDGRHLNMAAKWLEKVIDLDPGNDDAQHSLLRIYSQTGQRTEMEYLAGEILKKHPSDVEVMRSRASAQIALNKFDDARKTLDAVLAIEPLDIDTHMVVLGMLEKTPGKFPKLFDTIPAASRSLTLPETYRKYADLVLAAHPTDARAEVIASMALLMARDGKAAQAHVEKAATMDLRDRSVLVLLVRQMDILGQFDQATKLIETRAKADPTVEARRDLALRLFYFHRYREVLDTLTNFDMAPADADPDTMGAKALALVKLGRPEEAMKVINVMKSKGSADHRAEALGNLLEASLLDEKSPDPARFEQMKGNLRGGLMDCPIAFVLLGNASLRRGNEDQALQYWDRASRGAQGWAEPYLQASRVYQMMGRADMALNTAYMAMLRLPNDKETMCTYVNAAVRVIPQGDEAYLNNVLTFMDKIEAISPMEPQILPARIKILVDLKRLDEAQALVTRALAITPPLSEDYLIHLADECQTVGLPMVPQVLALSEKAHGMSPALAMAHAKWLKINGNPAAGLAYIEDIKKKQPSNDMGWLLVWADYLDLIKEPRARQAWLDLSSNYPKDPAVQWAALNCAALAEDIDMRDVILRRLEDMSRDQDKTSLNLYRARWILQSAESPEGRKKPKDELIKEFASAESMLKNVLKQDSGNIVALRLHAQSVEVLDQLQHPGQPPHLQDALNDLKAAAALMPMDPSLTLDYARLLRNQGDLVRAADVARPVATKEYISTPDQKRQAISFMAAAGRTQECIDLIEQLPPSKSNDAYRLQAMLYRQRGDYDKVEPLVRKMLESPDIASVQFAADFYAGTGRPAEARAALAQLDNMSIPPVYRVLIRAAFARAHGLLKDAEGYIQEAIRLEPSNMGARRELVVVRILEGDQKGTDEAILTGARDIHDDLVMREAAKDENRAAIVRFVQLEGLRNLVASVMGDAAESAGSMEALNIFMHADDAKEMLGETAPKIGRLAEDHPKNLPLQMAAIQLYARSGRMADANGVADRAMQAFPASPDPAAVAANTMASLKQWPGVILRATEWKHRAPDQSIVADERIADAYIHMEKWPEAILTLQPYLDRAKASPEQYMQVILLYTRGLVGGRNYDEARALLRPLINKPVDPSGVDWVDTALTVIVEGVRDENAAEDWMNELGAVIPDGTMERARFAQGWFNLSDRFKNVEYSQRARGTLEQIAKNDNAPSSVVATLGGVYEILGDIKNAELMYDRAIKLNSREAVAANNLAMIYARRGDKLNDALDLINGAVKMAPTFAAFHDTKSAVLARQGDTKGAIAEANIAVRMDSGNAEWLLTLLDLQVNSKDEATRLDARKTLAELDAHEKATLTDEQIKRLQSLRLKVAR